MKNKFMQAIAPLAIGLFVLGTTTYGQQRDATDTRISHPVMEATAITKEDAQKKYPPKGGAYPPGNRNPHGKDEKTHSHRFRWSRTNG